MKVSLNWIRQYTDIPLSPEAYMNRMIMTGTAIDALENLDKGLENVVVGRVLRCEKLAGSDHLSVCQVDAGCREPLQIVCGAPNVKAGMVAPVALPGARLPGGMAIKKGKIRGVESHGMLCSADELDIPQHLYPSVGAEGLLVLPDDLAPGGSVSAALGLDDIVADFDILANRPDCLSVWGIARESAAALNTAFNMPEISFRETDDRIEDHTRVTVEEPALCPRYAARVVKNVRIGPSPLWLRARLHAAGMRSINNIVDITNFIMLETGHPMHAFDLQHVKGRHIIVRKAQPGETLTTLDGKTHALIGDELLICDEGGPTGLAGIMGGLDSEITSDTREILFECAAFDRANTRITARRLGIRTESSGRFERGVSPCTVMTALDRACQMTEMLGAGDIVSGAIDIYPVPQAAAAVTGSVRSIQRLMGVDIPAEEMVSILRRLYFKADVSGDTLTATAPDFRQDIGHEADLAEEVLRMAGYDCIPSTRLRGETTQGGNSLSGRRRAKLAGLLSGMGFDEIMTYSFTGQRQLDMLGMDADDKRQRPFRIINPLGEDTAVMRTTLAADMLRVLATNMNHGNGDAALYEFGTLFDFDSRTDEGLPMETPSLALGCYGAGADFYALRDTVLTLLNREGVAWDIQPGGEPWMHPGRCAQITAGGETVAVVGEAHPDVADRFALTERAFVADVYLDRLYRHAKPLDTVNDLLRTPAVGRDIALVLPEGQPLLPVQQAICRAAGDLLEDVRLFDVYRGAQAGEGKKSAAFAMTFRAPDRTLTEQEITALMDRIVRSVTAQFGAEVRS